MTTVLLSAGDASGDLHAADFVEAVRKRLPDARFAGLGGGAMEKAGVELIVDQKELAVGGFVELAGSLRRLVRAWRAMSAALDRIHPDLVVLVDSGGFNIPFARRVRRRCAARILYYVAPQVWAWRPGRIRKIAARVDRVAVIFPFESAAYADVPIQVDFVGHPLVEKLAEVASRLGKSRARELLNVEPDARLVVLLPGSRRNEIEHQLPIAIEAARCIHLQDPRVEFALVLAPSIDASQVEALLEAAALPSSLRLVRIAGQTSVAIRAADVALVKPGTVTVEVMMLERPMVVMGHVSELSAIILRRAVRVPWYAMPNLIAGHEIVPEFMQEDAGPSRIADAVLQLMAGPRREEQLVRLAEARRCLGTGGAADSAAEIAQEMIRDAAAGPRQHAS